MDKGRNSAHWAAKNERGNRFFLKLTATLACRLPPAVLSVLMRPVMLYFYLTAARERRYIRCYHERLYRCYPEIRLPARAVWRQFTAFARSIADRFAVWQKRITYSDLQIEDPDQVYAAIRASIAGKARGSVLMCSHVGNIEICRALVNHHRGFVLNVLVHSKNSRIFNEALVKAGADDIRLIQVTDLDAALMLDLKNRTDRGEWLAVAADRIPVRGEKTVSVPFLGDTADFPQGPWLLAGLLAAPVHTVFCCRQDGRYHLKLSVFSDPPRWQRRTREAVVTELVSRYAGCLAEACRTTPLQWFNFYDFWGDDAQSR